MFIKQLRFTRKVAFRFAYLEFGKNQHFHRGLLRIISINRHTCQRTAGKPVGCNSSERHQKNRNHRNKLYAFECHTILLPLGVFFA